MRRSPEQRKRGVILGWLLRPRGAGITMRAVLLLGCSAAALAPQTAPPRRGVAAAAKKEGQGRGRLRRRRSPRSGPRSAKPRRSSWTSSAATSTPRRPRASTRTWRSCGAATRSSSPTWPAARRCDPAAPARGRDRLLAMTWDTVADYLPVETAGRGPGRAARARRGLRRAAAASTSAAATGPWCRT